ncbi:MAG: hypothetical protein IT382_16210, partial [Deltaproteobacteria bacterium]|nr:hypothetical protein [Deltaproteobacteria bacterium]
ANVVGAGKHKDAPKRVGSGTSQHVALDARLSHLDAARAKKLAAGVAMAGAVVLPGDALRSAIACTEAAGGVPNIPGGLKLAELDVAAFLRALSTAGKIRVVADTGAAGPPASLACLAPDGALLVRADALAGAGGRKPLTLALVRAALEQRVRGDRSDPETLRRASVYADAFARVIAPALDVPLGSPHVALPDLTGHAYYPAAGDDASALIAVRHAFPHVTHALATDLEAIECTGACRGLPGLVIERKSGDAYDPTAALKDGALPSVVMLSCPGDWGSLLKDPRFVARMIGVTAPGGVLANHARYMYGALVSVLPPSTLGLALADVQVPPGTRSFVELFQKIGVVAEDELMARIELDRALAALAARRAGQGWAAREDTLPLVRRALEEPLEDITRELVARAAAVGVEAEAAAKAALSAGTDAVVLSLPEIGDTRALPVSAARLSFDGLTFDEVERYQGSLLLDVGVGPGAFAAAVSATDQLEIIEHGGLTAGLECSAGTRFEVASFSLAADVATIEMSIEKQDPDKTLGLETFGEHLTFSGADCACPDAGSGVLVDVPRPLGQDGAVARARVTWSATAEAGLCARAEVALEGWPQSCDAVNDVAGDCAQGATAAVLAELLTSLCALP